MITRSFFAAVLGILPLIARAQGKNNPQITSDATVIDEIAFAGLRRIPVETLKATIVSRVGDSFSTERLRQDVRTLGRLGWFDSVRVETEEDYGRPQHRGGVRLTFFSEERPFVTEVQYGGSRLLSKRQIETLIAQKKLAPKLGEPEDRAALHHIAKEIEAALQQSGHAEAHVVVREELSARATVRVRFEINDGPRRSVGRLKFVGNPGISERLLHRQMRRLAPGAFLAGWRSKNSYTPQAFEEDRERLLRYYANHGYPEARIGAPEVLRVRKTNRAWLLWPHKTNREQLEISIPVQAGPFYSIAAVDVSDGLAKVVAENRQRVPANMALQPGMPFSADAVEDLRRAWDAAARRKSERNGNGDLLKVEAVRAADAETHAMRIKLRLSNSQPYIVRRLEFRGLRRFPDRYFRKRIALKEGAPLDDRALEIGLARLARTGYFKPIEKEDVTVKTDEASQMADVTIRVEEKGQQRLSLVGGRGQFGNTLGIAYTLYNLLDREEVLSSRIEDGPESLQLALGFAKEGILGSRGTLALSLFDTLLRPRLIGTVKGPFFEQHSEGISADWSYALSATDTISVDYGLSRSTTQYSLGLPPGLTGLPRTEIRTVSSSHSLGMGWERDTGTQRILFADSVSGGLLGGSENLLRTKAEYARIFHDDVFKTRNSWAFRSSFSGVASYAGDMPAYSRWFAGDQFVRGLRDGELGPEAVVSSISSSGARVYSATPAGANAIGALNAEYRVPLRGSTDAAAFFDLGSGRLLPNWLGPNRPMLVGATNGLLHGSAGVEVRWAVPGVNVPVRVYYGLNVLRLNHLITLPDGSLFRARNRFSALGWGLGAMF